MIRGLVYCAVATLAIVNGIISPKTFTVFALQGIWYPAFFPAPLKTVFVLSAIITALLHAMVTGIPVALFEGWRPDQKNSTTSAMIWLASMLIPTLMLVLPLF